MTARLRELSEWLDRCCARLNSGLAAVAVALAIAVLALAIARFQPYRDLPMDQACISVVESE